MANLWFRLYSEFSDDPKVQMLPEPMQRRLIMLFCSKCKQETLQEHQRAFHWRISAAELAETKSLFIECGFIDEKWNLLNWNKRQFISDSSTDRTRRYRERHETSQERHGNATETVCDALDTDTEADTESETEAEKSIAPSSNERDASAPPIGTLPCIGKPKVWHLYQSKVDEWQETYVGIDVKAELRKARQWLIDNPGDRKTYKGMPRFLNRWLAKTQDERGRNGSSGTARLSAADQKNRDRARLLEEFVGADDKEANGPDGKPLPRPNA